ncbi:Hsp33 family molecular chaperone HslO [Mycoplasmopsis agassizii]|uniref:Hsp33 family molecular chaperone HslO n=1 Tax=Mycoplasmopsis agassizii TaxID=33922 RepID=UPI0035289E4A
MIKIEKTESSYTKILEKGNVRIFLSDNLKLVNKLLNNHKKATPFAKLIFANIVSAFSPLLFVISKFGSVRVKLNTNGAVAPVDLYLDRPGNIRANMTSFEVLSEYDKEPLKVNDIPLILGIGDEGTLEIVTEVDGKSYSSKVKLARGDVITDLAYFFDQSWQQFTGIKTGVWLDENANIINANSIIMQLLPGHNEEDILWVENFLKNNDFRHLNVSQIEEKLDAKLLAKFETNDKCICSRSKKLKTITNLDNATLDEVFNNKNAIEVACPQCGRIDRISKVEVDKRKNENEIQ